MEATGCGRRTSRVSYLRASQLVRTPNPAVQRTGGLAVLALRPLTASVRRNSSFFVPRFELSLVHCYDV